MQTTLQTNRTRVKYVLLGRNTGGFHDRFGNVAIVTQNLMKLRCTFGNNTSTLMVARGGSRVVMAKSNVEEAECDALITMSVKHNLLIRPADCVPLLIYSSHSPVLALVHASRTSLELGIIEKTIKKLSSLGVEQKDCVAHICPGIASETYVLPVQIMDELHQPSWKDNTQVAGGSVALDMSGFAKTELLRLGVPKHQITMEKINTAKGDQYFSHYRATRQGEENGRNGFVCAIETV